MPDYSTELDFKNARETEHRIAAALGCEVLVQPRYSTFDSLFRFPDGETVAVEIKRRKGLMGKWPMDRTVWLSQHKRTAAAALGLPLWFIVAADNGDFIWPDEGQQYPVHMTGRHGRPQEPVLQIPVSAFIAVETAKRSA
jgi:hypothetical protein